MLIKVTRRGQHKKYINTKMKQAREYSAPEHLNSKYNQPLAACAVTIFALLCIHSMTYLPHTKENLEWSQNVALTENCTQFSISSNRNLFTTKIISDNFFALSIDYEIITCDGIAIRKKRHLHHFPPHMDQHHDIFAKYLQQFHEVTAPNSLLRLKAVSTYT